MLSNMFQPRDQIIRGFVLAFGPCSLMASKREEPPELSTF